MTPTKRQEWGEKIHAVKQAGIGMPERVERARRELAAEAAARAEPEPPSPSTPVVRNNDSVAEPAAEAEVKDIRTMPKTPVTTDARRDEPPPATSGGLLKSRDAARILGICERTLWSLDRSGEIPRVNIGRAVRYDPKDLYAWIERQKR